MAQYKKIIVCPKCNRERKHYSLGMCASCYARKRRQDKKIPEIPPRKTEDQELYERFTEWMTT